MFICVCIFTRANGVVVSSCFRNLIMNDFLFGVVVVGWVGGGGGGGGGGEVTHSCL